MSSFNDLDAWAASIEKAKSGSGGWSSIPGGKKGGERRPNPMGGYDYRYKNKNAEKHHKDLLELALEKATKTLSILKEDPRVRIKAVSANEVHVYPAPNFYADMVDSKAALNNLVNSDKKVMQKNKLSHIRLTGFSEPIIDESVNIGQPVLQAEFVSPDGKTLKKTMLNTNNGSDAANERRVFAVELREEGGFTGHKLPDGTYMRANTSVALTNLLTLFNKVNNAEEAKPEPEAATETAKPAPAPAPSKPAPAPAPAPSKPAPAPKLRMEEREAALKYSDSDAEDAYGDDFDDDDDDPFFEDTPNNGPALVFLLNQLQGIASQLESSDKALAERLYAVMERTRSTAKKRSKNSY